MAIGTPTGLGTGTSNSASTVTANTSGAISSAGKIFAFVVWGADPTAATVSVSGGSLTWTADASITNTNGTVHYGMSIYSAEVSSLSSGTTITATFSGATPFGALLGLATVTGLASTSYLDQTPAATFRTTPTTTWTTPTLTTANADDLLWAVALSDANGSGRTSTATSPLTELLDWEQATIAWDVTVGYRIVAATGSYSASGTWNIAPDFTDTAGIAAYKAAGGGGGGGGIVSPLQAFGPSYAAQRAARI